MKTLKLVQRNTKHTTHKHTQNLQHTYFIVKCYDDNDKPYYEDLDSSVLENFLQILNVQPNTTAIKSIRKFDKENTYIKNKNNKLVKVKQSKFCALWTIKLPVIPKFIKIQADIFIYYINSLHMNKRYDSFNKYLVNIFNKTIITKIIDKYNLTLSFKKIAPEATKLFIPNTFKIDAPRDTFEFPLWYILRPIDGFGGNDIKYVNSKRALYDAIRFYNNNSLSQFSTTKKYGNDVIASEYITTPLLFNSRKFHLRLYYLVFYSKHYKVFNSFYLDTLGKLFTAKLPFTMDEHTFNNKDIHDTHADTTDEDYFYPASFTHDKFTLSDNTKIANEDKFNNKVVNMKNQIKLIMSIISQIMVTKCTGDKCDELLYNTDANAYHIFGIDIMIDDTNNKFIPKLIEINFAPGFGHKPETKHETQSLLSNGVYGWINETVLEPLLKDNNPLLARKHSTYIIPYNELKNKTNYENPINKPKLK